VAPQSHPPQPARLALLFGMNALDLYAMFTFLPTRLIDAGLTDGKAGAMLALFAGVGVLPSLLLIPVLLARIGRSGLMGGGLLGLPGRRLPRPAARAGDADLAVVGRGRSTPRCRDSRTYASTSAAVGFRPEGGTVF
jgi:hypothetical protein